MDNKEKKAPAPEKQENTSAAMCEKPCAECKDAYNCQDVCPIVKRRIIAQLSK